MAERGVGAQHSCLPPQIEDLISGLDAPQAPSLVVLRSFLTSLSTALSPTSRDIAYALFNEACNGKQGAGATDGAPRLRLLLTHDCASTVCDDAHCQLCANNSLRRCADVFAPKYLVMQNIQPACQSPAYVAVEREDGTPATDADLQALSNFRLQVCAMPADFYERHRTELTDTGAWARLREDCNTVVHESKGVRTVVLDCASGGQPQASGVVDVDVWDRTSRSAGCAHGSAQPKFFLPQVAFKRSAESMLKGRKPQMVLVVNAVDAVTGESLEEQLAHSASSSFCVATQRTKANTKPATPSTDDKLGVLHNIGDRKVEVLERIGQKVAEARDAYPEIVLPVASVQTVHQLQLLVEANAADATREDQLVRFLNMNKEVWRALKEQLKRAVQPDSRLRLYTSQYPPTDGLLCGTPYGGIVLAQPLVLGMVFGCERGAVDLERGLALTLKSISTNTEVLLPLDFTQHMPRLVPSMHEAACLAWRESGHPGWALYRPHGAVCERLPQPLQPYSCSPPGMVESGTMWQTHAVEPVVALAEQQVDLGVPHAAVPVPDSLDALQAPDLHWDVANIFVGTAAASLPDGLDSFTGLGSDVSFGVGTIAVASAGAAGATAAVPAAYANDGSAAARRQRPAAVGSFGTSLEFPKVARTDEMWLPPSEDLNEEATRSHLELARNGIAVDEPLENCSSIFVSPVPDEDVQIAQQLSSTMALNG